MWSEWKPDLLMKLNLHSSFQVKVADDDSIHARTHKSLQDDTVTL